jgi:SPP1 family predicted phage head-tail adaptor
MDMKNKKIDILKWSDDALDGEGGYEPYIKNIWAYYRHVSGKEFYAAAASNIEVEVIFQINYRDDIDLGEGHYGVLYKGKEYDITQIDDFEGNKTDLKIYATCVN